MPSCVFVTQVVSAMVAAVVAMYLGPQVCHFLRFLFYLLFLSLGQGVSITAGLYSFHCSLAAGFVRICQAFVCVLFLAIFFLFGAGTLFLPLFPGQLPPFPPSSMYPVVLVMIQLADVYGMQQFSLLSFTAAFSRFYAAFGAID